MPGPATMRMFVFVLAILAGLKIWAGEQLFRASAEETIVAAYREKAMAACQRDSGQGEGSKDARHLIARAWAKPAEIRLVIGKRNVDVNIWDRDNALWNVRFKHPFLVLTAAPGTGLQTCEYDITLGQAAITRL